MPTVLLVRHGHTAANAAGVLAGWTAGVGLDQSGRDQAARLAGQLAAVQVSAVVSSPLQRCLETVAALLAVDGPPGPRGGRPKPRPRVEVDDRLGECRYGDWTGRTLKELAEQPLWRTVQLHPSAVVFPGVEGESMLDMQHRAVTAIREHDARVADRHGADAVWLAISHGDVIKSILADALGMHLDAFQRLVVDPCSVSVIRYTPLRPFAVRVNGNGTDLAGLVPAQGRRRPTAPGPARSDTAATDPPVDGSSAIRNGTRPQPATASRPAAERASEAAVGGGDGGFARASGDSAGAERPMQRAEVSASNLRRTT